MEGQQDPVMSWGARPRQSHQVCLADHDLEPHQVYNKINYENELSEENDEDENTSLSMRINKVIENEVTSGVVGLGEDAAAEGVEAHRRDLLHYLR